MRMHSSLLLVRPEDFLSSSPWHPDQHAYVRVLSTQPDHVVVQDFPGSMHQGQLRLNTVQERAVTEQDANTATGEFLRKAVCGVVRGTYVYGQVESYQGKSVTVRQGDRAVRLAASRLDEIAPVVCLLMKNSAVKTSDITRAALRDFNVTILDRILGYNGWDGSRDIADILNGILPSNEQPNGSEIRTWVNPITAFGMRFYNATTQAFITAAMGFAATITGMGMWNASAVDLITFWFDGVLDDYLRAIEEMVVSGVDNRDNIRQRLTKSDPDFFNTMHLIHSEASAPAAKDQGRSDRSATKRSPAESKRTRVPQDIIAALPSQNGKSVCLKFLTRAGCPSRSPKRCMFGRAHFIPEKLEPVVRQYINDNMGGIRRDIPPDQ
ncbi:hypothetical protein PF007_g23302 [Phytophthora fragariae]|uniref:Uncharacterized protein n=1 Tax=Phytophthora fragariae TaxID=53985 RepID=A0A6A3QP76_9STRA|nr:hypothetical protein PF007_g23302 [Phytophthora fragariae]